MMTMRRKTVEQITAQVDRIYRLYGQGYGSSRMVRECDEKVYVIFLKLNY